MTLQQAFDFLLAFVFFYPLFMAYLWMIGSVYYYYHWEIKTTNSPEEIPELARHLLERHRVRMKVPVESISPEAMEYLLEYPWPGNVRELENVLERAMVLAEEESIQPEDLPEHVRVPAPRTELADSSDDLSVKRRTAELERHLIQRALDRTGGNKTRAAELLDLSPRALRYKLHDYGLKD